MCSRPRWRKALAESIGWLCVVLLVPGLGSAAAPAPGGYFLTVSDFLKASDDFKYGYAEGVYDAVSMFATAAQQSTLNVADVVALFHCLDSQGKTVGDLTGWVDGVVRSASGSEVLVTAISEACQQPFSAAKFSESASDFQDASNDEKYGYVEGVYDTVSLYAYNAARPPAGLNRDAVIAMFKCLDAPSASALVALLTNIAKYRNDYEPRAPMSVAINDGVYEDVKAHVCG